MRGVRTWEGTRGSEYLLTERQRTRAPGASGAGSPKFLRAGEELFEVGKPTTLFIPKRRGVHQVSAGRGAGRTRAGPGLRRPGEEPTDEGVFEVSNHALWRVPKGL